MTKRTKIYLAVLGLLLMTAGGMAPAPTFADPTPPDKGKQGKGKGDGGDTMPIKVEPPIITKDPKSPPPPPPPPPKKKAG